MRRAILGLMLGAGLAVLAFVGCATKSYVRQTVANAAQDSDRKLGEVQQQVETAQMDVTNLKQSDDQQSTEIAHLSATARDALTRAQEAGKLAQGKFLYQVVLTDQSVHFPLDSAELSQQAKKELDKVADNLKQDDRSVYIEIQGFTDSTGSKEFDLRLGRARAETVMRYLNMHQGVPLHRMNVISYGKDNPIASNETREGRAKNRRVALVVLG
jgi:peptidoglycan-associated lipoprotein